MLADGNEPDVIGEAIIPVLACVLEKLCGRNDLLDESQRPVTKFHALNAPAIPIHDYLIRLSKYSACRGECFLLALIYIDRVIQTNPRFVVCSLNVHRLLITSLMVGIKFICDQYFNNAYYAKVGGVLTAEINLLEVEFLFLLNFTLFVPTDIYVQYHSEMRKHCLATPSQCNCHLNPLPVLVLLPELQPDPNRPDIAITVMTTFATPQSAQASRAAAHGVGVVDCGDDEGLDGMQSEDMQDHPPFSDHRSSPSHLSSTHHKSHPNLQHYGTQSDVSHQQYYAPFLSNQHHRDHQVETRPSNHTPQQLNHLAPAFTPNSIQRTVSLPDMPPPRQHIYLDGGGHERQQHGDGTQQLMHVNYFGGGNGHEQQQQQQQQYDQQRHHANSNDMHGQQQLYHQPPAFSFKDAVRQSRNESVIMVDTSSNFHPHPSSRHSQHQHAHDESGHSFSFTPPENHMMHTNSPPVY